MRARARVFMIVSRLLCGHHIRPRFTEPLLFFFYNLRPNNLDLKNLHPTRIAFADPQPSRYYGR